LEKMTEQMVGPSVMQRENGTCRKAESDTSIPILSFFTGAGFLDIGFIQAGFSTIWCNEVNQSFVSGYLAGMSRLLGTRAAVDLRVNTTSVVDLDSREISDEAFNRSPRPTVFGIIGGPPCPDFSVGGKNRGGMGDNGKLSKVYIDRICDLRPTFFVFENVPGLLRTAKHRRFLDSLIVQLSSDYATDLRVLNALDFGVAQDRERVFLIGFRKSWMAQTYGVNRDLRAGWFPWPIDERFHNAKSRFNWPKTSPFGGNPTKPEDIPDELMVGPLICNESEIARLPNGTEGFIPRSRKFFEIDEGDDSRKSFKRLHRWRYSPTAAYGNNEVHLHPTQPRRLTVREALRIQAVPDSYVLPEELPLTHKFKMIGNGVPVRLAYWLAHSIRQFLDGEGAASVEVALSGDSTVYGGQP